MAINKDPRQEVDRPETTLQEAGETVSAEVKEPKPHKSISREEAEKVRSQAKELIKQLEDATGYSLTKRDFDADELYGS